jgi:hypothetical protein
MNTESVENEFAIEPAVDGKFEWNEDNNILIFDPIENLSEQQTYTISISTSALDLFNNSLLKSYTWQFTTAAFPKVMDYSPMGSFVRTDTNILITFNIEMNQTSVNSAFSILPDTIGDFNWSKDNFTLIFEPDNNLIEQTEFMVSIEQTASSYNGISLGSPFNWNFTTGDFTAPQIIGHSPTGDNVPVTTNISITFNELMNKTSVIESFNIENNVDGEFYWVDNTLFFQPNEDLEYNTKYTITITTGAEDASGNFIHDQYSWNFTTEKKETENGSEKELDMITFYSILILIVIIIVVIFLLALRKKRQVQESEDESESLFEE